MTPNDRELSLYAKIEKLEKALVIAKEALAYADRVIRCSHMDQSLSDKLASLREDDLMKFLESIDEIEKIEKELG